MGEGPALDEELAQPVRVAEPIGFGADAISESMRADEQQPAPAEGPRKRSVAGLGIGGGGIGRMIRRSSKSVHLPLSRPEPCVRSLESSSCLWTDACRGDFDFDDEPDDRPGRSRRGRAKPRAGATLIRIDLHTVAEGEIEANAPLLILAHWRRRIDAARRSPWSASWLCEKRRSDPKPAASGATAGCDHDRRSAARDSRRLQKGSRIRSRAARRREVVEKVQEGHGARSRAVQQPKGRGSGSGFVEKDSGLVLTNAHVLGLVDKKDRGPRAIELVVNSGEGPGKEYSLGGELVAVDTESDLALIRPLFLQPGAPRRPGGADGSRNRRMSTLLQRLFVFGYPFGEQLGNEITVSDTSVSSLRRDPATGKLAMVQVKGGMNPGNSGGPVVDARRERGRRRGGRHSGDRHQLRHSGRSGSGVPSPQRGIEPRSPRSHFLRPPRSLACDGRRQSGYPAGPEGQSGIQTSRTVSDHTRFRSPR